MGSDQAYPEILSKLLIRMMQQPLHTAQDRRKIACDQQNTPIHALCSGFSCKMICAGQNIYLTFFSNQRYVGQIQYAVQRAASEYFCLNDPGTITSVAWNRTGFLTTSTV